METRTHLLTERKPVTREQLADRLAANGAASGVEYNGFTDVYVNDVHVARWLRHTGFLWFEPQNGSATPERTLEDPSVWPPRCPDCGGEMIVKWGGRPREPFWSCRKWDSPWPRSCTGRRPFSLHPDEMEAYRAYDPPDNPWWSLRTNKTARQAAKDRKWVQLVERSLERLNGGGR